MKFQGDQQSGEQLSAETDVDVVSGQVGPCVTLELKRPDINFRRVDVTSGMFVHDEDLEEAQVTGAHRIAAQHDGGRETLGRRLDLRRERESG